MYTRKLMMDNKVRHTLSLSPILSPEYTDEAQIHSVNMQECLKLILEWGGDVECRDAQGMTPLHWALQFPSQCNK